jgi:Rod binding domain-containing protein
MSLGDGSAGVSTLTGLLSGAVGARGAGNVPISPEKAAEEFEAYVLKLVLSEMSRTVSPDGLFSGRTTRMYQSMLEDALARRAAEAGTFGLAQQLLRDWGGEP